jgi:hypothetical protein
MTERENGELLWLWKIVEDAERIMGSLQPIVFQMVAKKLGFEVELFGWQDPDEWSRSNFGAKYKGVTYPSDAFDGMQEQSVLLPVRTVDSSNRVADVNENEDLLPWSLDQTIVGDVLKSIRAGHLERHADVHTIYIGILLKLGINDLSY